MCTCVFTCVCIYFNVHVYMHVSYTDQPSNIVVLEE